MTLTEMISLDVTTDYFRMMVVDNPRDCWFKTFFWNYRIIAAFLMRIQIVTSQTCIRATPGLPQNLVAASRDGGRA
jgi:hypothetical protein